MFFNILLIIAGIYLLVSGSRFLIRGTTFIAKRFGISMLVIGLTVVALGTSAPELFVSILATARGATEIPLGIVLGSNLANILLVLGVVAMVHPVELKSRTIRKEIPLSLFAVVLVFVLGNDMFLNQSAHNMLSRTDGIVLFVFFLVFLFFTFYARRDRSISKHVEVEHAKLSHPALFAIGSLCALLIGGTLVVEGATHVAELLHVSQNLIALTIVAVGTSLPEFVSSVVAVRKGHTDLAIGNIIGSNILNIFFILSVSAMMHPLPMTSANMIDLIIVAMVTLILFVKLFVGRKHVIERWNGAVLVLLYVGFIAYAIARG